MKKEDSADESAFVPKGAIAFFAALLVFYAAVWGGLYAVMVGRR